MSMSDIKIAARNSLHARLAEPCTYEDRATPVTPSVEQSAEGLILTVRFAMKTRIASAESDAVSIMENIERLIFNQPQLDALGLELDVGGVVSVPGYEINFILDQPIDPDGPINVYWTVVREG
jgi:hypothetical protein